MQRVVMAELDGEILDIPALAADDATAVPDELPDASSMGEALDEESSPVAR